MICTMCFSSLIYAQTVDQVLDLRLSKAKLFTARGKYKSAYLLLIKNLEAKKVHPASYYYLSKLYTEKGSLKKSFQVLYMLIKKQHQNNFLNKRIDEINFDKDLGRDALKTYFIIADKYLKESEDGVYSKEFQTKLLLLSKKYFTVCEKHNFKLASSKANIGKIYISLNNSEDAIRKLLDATQSIPDERNKAFKTERLTKEDINLLIGQSLIKEGQIEAGKLYLRQVSNSPSSSTSLKEYSKTMQDFLKKDYIDVDFSYLVNNSTNIFEFRDTEKQSFQTLNPDISESGIYHNRNFNFLMNKNFLEKWHAKFNASFGDKVATDSLQEAANERSLTMGIETGIHESSTSTINLKYELESFYSSPNTTDTSLTKEYSIAKFVASWIKASSKATYIFRFPYEKYVYDRTDNTGSGLGVTFSYIPFKKTQYWNPQYYGSYKNIFEADASTSTSLIGGITNKSIINDDWDLVSSFDFENRSNESESLSYTQLDFRFNFTYYYKFMKDLRSDLGLKSVQRSYSDNDKMGQIDFYAGVGYTF